MIHDAQVDACASQSLRSWLALLASPSSADYQRSDGLTDLALSVSCDRASRSQQARMPAWDAEWIWDHPILGTATTTLSDGA